MPPFNERGKGTYILILQLENPARIEVGKLGLVAFDTGIYTYVGSAFGPGGLAARVGHHLRTRKRCHWHIDYLRRICRVSAVWYTIDSVRREHEWAQILAGIRGAKVPIIGFGSSDCRCPSHLAYFHHSPNFITFRRKIRQHFADDSLTIQMYDLVEINRMTTRAP